MISGKDRNEILCVAPGVWLFLRERHLSHRLLAGYYAIVDALCTPWNALTPRQTALPNALPVPEPRQVLGAAV